MGKDKALLAIVPLLAALCGCGGGGGESGGSPPPTPSPVPTPPPPPPPAGAVFPLRVESGRRYLLNASGDPLFLQGDAAWSMIARLTREDITAYLDDRRDRGFNCLIVELIEHKFTDHPPNNAYGDPPFLTAGDFSTPNETYFAHADFALNEAEKRGITVLLAPAYLGFNGGDEGWYQEMQQQGTTRLRGYGRYVAQRFASRKNIIWVQGGDYVPPDAGIYKAVAEGIDEISPDAIHTYHAARNSSALGSVTPPAGWLNLNNIYTSSDNVVASAFTEHARSSMPYFLIEAVYDGLGVDGAGVRRESWQATLSGANGNLIGHNTIWQFLPGWRAALDSEGAATISHLRELLTLADWPDLEPDTGGVLVTAGASSGAQQSATLRSADRRTAIVYVPTRRNLTLDLGQLAGGTIRARWFNPATGALTEMPGSPWTRSGTRNVTPPTAASPADWAMLLEGAD